MSCKPPDIPTKARPLQELERKFKRREEEATLAESSG